MLAPLRLMTCGSVDDGKSTLIGRLLWDSDQVFSDHAESLRHDSQRYGTTGDQIDFSLLLDGLAAERAQNITIDVSYRFFGTARRRFIVADCPGHEQYTRNMATGASHSDLAVLVCDARKGVLSQTQRHARIAALFGVRHVVIAVNKMDLVGWNEDVFRVIADDLERFGRDLQFESLYSIPLSALTGDNVTQVSSESAWYSGLTLLKYLEQVNTNAALTHSAFRMPVQLVNRPNSLFRGYCGRVAAGHVHVGDRVRVLPGTQEGTIKGILGSCGEQAFASPGDSVTLLLREDIDVPRGSVICGAEEPTEVGSQLEVLIVTLAAEPILAKRTFVVRLHTSESIGTILRVASKLDVATGTHTETDSLLANEIGLVDLQLSSPVSFESFRTSRRLGSLILIDQLSNETVGAGLIVSALRQSSDVYWHTLEVDKASRAARLFQKPRCFWFTGLPSSGKSTIANLLEKRLFAIGRHSYLLDGDNVRHGLSRDLCFSKIDRAEHVRRTAEVAKLFVDAGLIVLVALISPYREDRASARALFESGEFVEIFVDAPLNTCERRDPKGIYRKARRGEVKEMTGVDGVYEAPTCPELRLDTARLSPAECVERILNGFIEVL